MCVRRGWGRQAERMSGDRQLETCRGARNHRIRSLLIGPHKQNEKAHTMQRRCGTIPRPLDPCGGTAAWSPCPCPSEHCAAHLLSKHGRGIQGDVCSACPSKSDRGLSKGSKSHASVAARRPPSHNLRSASENAATHDLASVDDPPALSAETLLLGGVEHLWSSGYDDSLTR